MPCHALISETISFNHFIWRSVSSSSSLLLLLLLVDNVDNNSTDSLQFPFMYGRLDSSLVLLHELETISSFRVDCQEWEMIVFPLIVPPSFSFMVGVDVRNQRKYYFGWRWVASFGFKKSPGQRVTTAEHIQERNYRSFVKVRYDREKQGWSFVLNECNRRFCSTVDRLLCITRHAREYCKEQKYMGGCPFTWDNNNCMTDTFLLWKGQWIESRPPTDPLGIGERIAFLTSQSTDCKWGYGGNSEIGYPFLFVWPALFSVKEDETSVFLLQFCLSSLSLPSWLCNTREDRWVPEKGCWTSSVPRSVNLLLSCQRKMFSAPKYMRVSQEWLTCPHFQDCLLHPRFSDDSLDSRELTPERITAGGGFFLTETEDLGNKSVYMIVCSWHDI